MSRDHSTDFNHLHWSIYSRILGTHHNSAVPWNCTNCSLFIITSLNVLNWQPLTWRPGTADKLIVSRVSLVYINWANFQLIIKHIQFVAYVLIKCYHLPSCFSSFTYLMPPSRSMEVTPPRPCYCISAMCICASLRLFIAHESAFKGQFWMKYGYPILELDFGCTLSSSLSLW